MTVDESIAKAAEIVNATIPQAARPVALLLVTVLIRLFYDEASGAFFVLAASRLMIDLFSPDPTAVYHADMQALAVLTDAERAEWQKAKQNAAFDAAVATFGSVDAMRKSLVSLASIAITAALAAL